MTYRFYLIVLLLVGVMGCTTAPSALPQSSATTLTPVTLAMGYIPNVQFAPFYVAQAKGFFAEEGIALTLDYGMENDIIELVASNTIPFAIGSGDQVLLARAGGRPVTYVANWYRKFPIAIAAIETDITNPTTLEGKTIGLPGLFGANYIGWLAFAQATGINADTITLETIGFNQVPVLVEGSVDAVVVYAMNEPVQLSQEGYDVSTVLVSDYAELVANGLITNESVIADNPALVRGMVRALIRGIEYTLANPDEAFAIASDPQYGTGISAENAAVQRAVLEASLAFWQNDRIGYLPDELWQISHTVLRDADLLPSDVTLTAAYTNAFLP